MRTKTEGILDSLLEWAIDHLRLLCVASLFAVIAWQAYSGMYDWRAVTTSDLQHNWKTWLGRDVVLSNVSIRKYEIREQGADTFVRLWLVNGRTNPSTSENPVLVIGRMSTRSAKRIESLPWCLREIRAQRLVSARLTIRDGLAVLREYSLPLDASWFGTPYWFTVQTMNRLISLGASVWVGIAVQVLVYGGIAILIGIGLLILVPSLDG
jgi:hypothetical protein